MLLSYKYIFKVWKKDTDRLLTSIYKTKKTKQNCYLVVIWQNDHKKTWYFNRFFFKNVLLFFLEFYSQFPEQVFLCQVYFLLFMFNFSFVFIIFPVIFLIWFKKFIISV